MALDLTKIRAAVSRNTTVDGSAAELIRSVPGLIRDAIAADDVTDAAHLNELADSIEASSDSLAAAVAEHTPAAGGGGGEPSGGVVTGE